MSESLELQRDVTPMQLMQLAIEKEGSIDVIERLAKLQREQIEYHAMVEFNRGMHRCQQQMKRIATDMENPQTRSRYASYAQIDRTIRPIYTEEGFSLSFGDGEPIAPDSIRIICYVSHVDGHTRMYHKDMPIITTGPKGNDVMTKVHAHGSADQYAKRYLVKDIFNLAIGEDDDDGNGGGVKIPSEKVGEWLKSLGESTELNAHMKLWGKIYTTANELGDKNALDILIPAYEAKKSELSGAQ
jgi:ERF superfamily